MKKSLYFIQINPILSIHPWIFSKFWIFSQPCSLVLTRGDFDAEGEYREHGFKNEGEEELPHSGSYSVPRRRRHHLPVSVSEISGRNETYHDATFN